MCVLLHFHVKIYAKFKLMQIICAHRIVICIHVLRHIGSSLNIVNCVITWIFHQEKLFSNTDKYMLPVPIRKQRNGNGMEWYFTNPLLFQSIASWPIVGQPLKWFISILSSKLSQRVFIGRICCTVIVTDKFYMLSHLNSNLNSIFFVKKCDGSTVQNVVIKV